MSRIYSQFYIIRQNFSSSITNIFGFLYCKVYLAVILTLNALLWWGSYYIYTHVSGKLLILHYNVDFGIDLIGEHNDVFFIPLLALIFSFLNISFLLFFYKEKYLKFMAHLFLSSSVLVNIILLTALMSIYLINFR